MYVSRQEIDYSTCSNRKHLGSHGETEVRIESNDVNLEIPRYDNNHTKDKEEKTEENAKQENSPIRQLSGMTFIKLSVLLFKQTKKNKILKYF